MDNKIKYKVTVSCMTYNQAKYITEAMNGFTMQQTSFPFVCTIVDDASTDGEQEVIRKYVEDNFDFSEGSVAYHKETDYAHITYAQHKTNKNCYFAVLYLKENHYSKHKDKSPYLKDWRDGVEYMAICEGDDYWSVPDKLEKQVRFLDENEDYGMCFTANKRLDEESGTVKIDKKIDGDINFDKLLKGNMIATLSSIFRQKIYNMYIKEINPIQKDWLLGDYPLWLYIAYNSKIYCNSDITSVYRMVKGSASNQTSYRKYLKYIDSTYDIKLFYTFVAKKHSRTLEYYQTFAKEFGDDFEIYFDDDGCVTYLHNKKEDNNIQINISSKLKKYIINIVKEGEK